MQASSRRMTGGVRGRRMHGVLVGGADRAHAAAAHGRRGGHQGLRAPGAHQPGLRSAQHHVGRHSRAHQHSTSLGRTARSYFEQIRRRIAALPEVVAAGISTNATPPDNGWMTPSSRFSAEHGAEQKQVRAQFRQPGILHGAAHSGAARPAVDQRGDRAAARAGGHQSDHGAPVLAERRRARTTDSRSPSEGDDRPLQPGRARTATDWLQIVGVVADARDDGLRNPVKPAVYVPYTLQHAHVHADPGAHARWLRSRC